MRLLKTLHEKEKFSAVEQSVIKYMLDNPKLIVNMSIRELASKTFTSSAAIFRLCQKCGLKGYTEFKVKFISEVNRTSDFEDGDLQGTVKDLNRPINGKDDLKSVVKKMAFLEIEAIEETKNEMDYEQLEKVASWLDEAKKICLFAFDLNFYIAQETVYHLLQASRCAVCYETANSQLVNALMMEQDEIAILLSRTGENRRLIRTARVLKKRQVKTILLTGNKSTTLAKLCDEVIYVANTEEYLNMGGLIFSIGCRYTLDVLFGILVAYNYKEVEKFIDTFEKINGGINDKYRLW